MWTVMVMCIISKHKNKIRLRSRWGRDPSLTGWVVVAFYASVGILMDCPG